MSQILPETFYSKELAVAKVRLADTTKYIRTIARLRLLVMLITIGLLVAAINYGITWQWIATGITTIVFLMLVRIHSRVHEQEKRLKILVYILEKELEALDGNISSFEAGEKYIDSGHPFSFDIDLFGKSSVYQLLNRTVTHNGSTLLADKLMMPSTYKEEIGTEQSVNRSIAGMPSFMQDFRVAGLSVPEESQDYQQLLQWLYAPDHFINNPVARAAIVIMPLAVIGLIIYSAIAGTISPWLGIAAAINWIVLLPLQKKIKKANIGIGRTAKLIEKYQLLQGVTAMQDFDHEQLQAVSEKCKASLAQIMQFRKLANTFDSRNNSMVGPLMNSLFLFDIYCLLRLEWWRKAHKELLLRTMEEIVRLDTQISCAIYTFNHPENTYPVFDTANNSIKAVNAKHPLRSKTAVGNDFTLGVEERFFLLTGANMTGKSTFIRTIGTCIVLASLGVPVPADELILPVLKLYTSMRVTDSVQDDISYFRAELNRIKAIITAVQQSDIPYLILLDEPLRGTNSADKQLGTRSVIESLLRYNAIGIVATHDTGLCDMADIYPGQISNYHFESAVINNELSFDYKLHPGGSTSNNATILMRQMGIIH